MKEEQGCWRLVTSLHLKRQEALQ
ncbi:hypothetical protein Patl1_06939 [Pistacia atlantica]|uniref:Uncharacterized protein n=1 Tax=Pistacia atlantica TaxID=434234 RepID=A0ACC1AKU4_9ROSI|nr:hypothetical protein Patl1_06939 [Pistacia atlantica]